MCTKTPKAPPPDPQIGQAMLSQTKLADESFAFFKQVYQDNMPRQQALDDMNLKLGEDLMRDAATNRQRSAEQYQFYMDKGRPVEQKFLEEAHAAGSEAERATARGRASADVAQAFGNVQQQNMRTMSRYGMRPNAERMASINSQLAAQQALGQAGAMTNAEQQAIDRGVALRGQAANVARGMPAGALQFGQAAQGAGQQAFGNMGAANQSAMGFQNQMASGYGQAANIHGNVANQGNSLYGNQIQAWQAQQSAKSNSMSGFGSLVGMGASMFMGSSKKSKEDAVDINDEAALEGLRNTKVQSWRYKDEEGGDGRRQIGPMAEDMQRAMGDSVAPGGRVIDVVSNLGVHHSAIRALADRLDQLEGGQRKAAFADGGMVGERVRDIRAAKMRRDDAIDDMSAGREPRQEVAEREAIRSRGSQKSAGEQVAERTRAAFGDLRKRVGFNDGGSVHGPGNGVSDSIPARLSKGEYVVPADVVRAKGVEFFDRLRDKYHTPAVQQRAAMRR